MIAFLYLMIMILAFFFPKNKKVSIIIFCVMWILFGWSSNNADYNIYQNRYYNYKNLVSQTEPLFSCLMRMFNFLNFSYEKFLIAISFVLLLILHKTLKCVTQHNNIVYLLYLIFPFCFDVVMIRYTIGTIIVVLGIKFLLFDEKKPILKYVICVVCATMIHYSFIITLIFVLIKFFDKKQIILLICSVLLMFIIFNSFLEQFMNIIKNIEFMNIGNKVSIVLNFANQNYDLHRTTMYILKTIIIYVFTFWVILTVKKSVVRNNDKELINLTDKVLGINILSMIILPLIIYSADIFRIQITLYLINYILVAKYFDNHKLYVVDYFTTKVTKNGIYILLLTIIYSFVGLYLWILRTPNVWSVLYPFFFENIFLKF